MMEDKGKLYMCTAVKKCSWQSTAPVSQRSWVQIPYRPEFNLQVLFQVVFIAARISYILFFTAVHIYDFHISTIIIHHLDGLFGPNIMTSPQLACSLVGRVLHQYCRGHGFKSHMGQNFFFSGLISTTSSVVFIAAKYSCVLIYFSN